MTDVREELETYLADFARVDAEADPHTIDGLIDVLCAQLGGTEPRGR